VIIFIFWLVLYKEILIHVQICPNLIPATE